MDLKFYTIDKHYIEFLRTYPKLSNVFDNKENTSSFPRKYLGIVLSINEYKYYVPLSSPKTSDYIVSDGNRSIRKSIIPIIRIIVANAKGDSDYCLFLSAFFGRVRRFSVPLSSRLMLLRCIQITSAAKIADRQVSISAGLP